MSIFGKLLVCCVALGFLGVVGFGALSWQPAIAPIAPPAPASFAPELVAKGEASGAARHTEGVQALEQVGEALPVILIALALCFIPLLADRPPA